MYSVSFTAVNEDGLKREHDAVSDAVEDAVKDTALTWSKTQP